jgi:ectoine hydroxylase-related dioxygenase (phytanoyl-CoA dioxygenase family)
MQACCGAALRAPAPPVCRAARRALLCLRTQPPPPPPPALAAHRRRSSSSAACAATTDAAPTFDALADDDGAALAAARASYDTEGWLLVRGVLSSSEVSALHAETDALEAAAAHLTSSGRVRGVFCEVQSASGRKGEPAVRPGALRKLTGPSRAPGARAFAALRAHPRLLRLVASVAGVRAPRCAVDQINTKAPRGVGTGFPWHQDASFLMGDAAKALSAHGGANAVLALDPSTSEVGGFEVLGRTHASTAGAAAPVVNLRGGAYDTAAPGANAGGWDECRRACPRMAPGDALLFHPRLAHGSGVNGSERRRRLATLWFVGGAEGAE